MFGGIGITEIIIILVVLLVFFGPGKLPELGSAIGKAVKGLKKTMASPEEKSAEPSGSPNPPKQPEPAADKKVEEEKTEHK